MTTNFDFPIHDCCDDALRHLWHYEWSDILEAWVFDADDGLRGPQIKYCPWCGIELPMNFADEAVRNCNTHPRSANIVADAQVEPEIAKNKETQ